MKRSLPLTIMALLGFAFLYVPILSLIVYSFNESKLVTVWSGFSFKWYVSLINDRQILAAARISLQIAFTSATLALVLGTLAAMAIVRYGRFRFRELFNGMLTTPLVMPDVIIGISLLLLFVAMEASFGWPAGRGMLTIIIAHTTFCMAYVAVVVQSRLADVDRSIEEAAADLGARPIRIFFDATLPSIAPALVSAWLLAFTLSLDDLVIASFVAGPGSTTLPMLIFSKVKLGVSPDVNALATILIGFVAVGIAISAFVMTRSKRGANSNQNV
jgi:putrescine transport system permease protein